MRLRADRPRAGLAALLLCAAACGATQAAAPAPECDAPEPSRRISASRTAPADARAAWLGPQLLRWPGKSAQARLRLYHAAGEPLALAIGKPLRGEGVQSAGLAPRIGPLPEATAQAFAWLGEGVNWSVPAMAFRHYEGWLGGDLLLVEEDAQGRVLDATRVQHAAALDGRFAAAEALTDLGATVSGDRAGFRVWAPTARRVSLCLYPDATAPASSPKSLQRDAATGAWSLTLPGDRRGQYYTYLVDVFVPGTGWVRNRVTDPYSVSLSADSRRSFVADLDDPALMPEGWAQAPRGRDLASATDAMLYELHVRDFSIADATVPQAHRGKYLGFTHAGSDGMRHLQALAAAGITDVHLLRCTTWAACPRPAASRPPPMPRRAPRPGRPPCTRCATRTASTGATTRCTTPRPEGSYATHANDGAARVREFRAMVMALHAAGLRVGMDVVYNHTFASGQDPRSVLDRLVPGYYHAWTPRVRWRSPPAAKTPPPNTA